MVRYYKKKISKKVQYTEGQLKLALDSIQSGQSIKSVAGKYDIPRTTLQKKFKNITIPTSNHKGFKRTFTDEQEKALCEYIIDMESKLLGLTTKELRKLAYDFAEELKILHQFDKTTRMAGKDWLSSFMKRNGLSNRKPQNTSAARANGFNKEEVDKFFRLLKEIQDKYNIPAGKIWNVDESGFSVVAKSNSRVIARKGRKQVGLKSSAERGENVTAEICMSATGVYMPPMLVFPRVKPNAAYLEGKPEGSWAEWDKSGYVNSEIFTVFFKKFIEFSHASIENQQILLLDGHYSHVKNLEVAKLAKENGVIILCFPPHCTHRMQPLDVSFMKPLSVCYGEEIKAFQRNGALVQMKNIFSVLGKAWQKAAKIETAINAFKATGIVPLNPHVFDHHFEQQSLNSSTSFSESSINEECVNVNVVQCKQIINEIMATKSKQVEKEVSTSAPQASSSKNDTSEILVESEVKIPLSMILQAKPLISLLHDHIVAASDSTQNSSPSELPQPIQEEQVVESSSKQTTVGRKRSRGTAAIITDDKYIENLIAENAKKIMKETKPKPRIPKSKPKIMSNKKHQNHVTVLNMQAPVQVSERQPLANFNYQYSQPINAFQQGIPDPTFQNNNDSGSYNAAILNGALVVQRDDGSFEPIYLT